MGSGYNRGKHGRGNARGRRGPPAGPARMPETPGAGPSEGHIPTDTTRSAAIPGQNGQNGQNGQTGPRGQRQNTRGSEGGAGRSNGRRSSGDGASARVRLMASQVAVATDGRAHPATPTTRETRDRHGLDGRENGRENARDGRDAGNPRQMGRGTPAVARLLTDASSAALGPNGRDGHTPLGHHSQAALRAAPVADTPVADVATADTSLTGNATGPGAKGVTGTTRTRGWRAVPPRPRGQPSEGAQTQPRETAREATHELNSGNGRLPRPGLAPAPTRAGMEDAAIVPVRTPDPTTAAPRGADAEASAEASAKTNDDAEEYAQLTVPVGAVEPEASPVTRPEVRGEWGPLIDSLRDLFARDRAVASTAHSARCGLCYLHHPLADLEYREAEGYYVCISCKQALGSARLPMVRRQQHAGR